MEVYHKFTAEYLRELCLQRHIEFNYKDLKNSLIEKLADFDTSQSNTGNMEGDEENVETGDNEFETKENTESEINQQKTDQLSFTFEQQMAILNLQQEHELRKQEHELRKQEYELRKQEQEMKLEHMRVMDKEEERKFKYSIMKEKEQSNVKLIKMRDMKEDEEVEEYLKVFEKTVQALNIPEKDWIANLAPKLNGKSRSVYLEMSGEDALNYNKIRDSILEAHQLTVEHYRYKFRNSQKQKGEDFVLWAKRTRRYLDSWMRVAEATDNADKILEQITLEKLYNSVSTELQVWLKEQKPTTAVELGKLANEHIEAKKGPMIGGKYMGGNQGQNNNPLFSSDKKSDKDNPSNQKKLLEGEKKKSEGSLSEVKCYNCRDFGHYANNCPKPDRRKSSENKKFQPHALLCLTPLETDMDNIPPTFIEGKIAGKKMKMVVDSGCSRTLVNSKFIPKGSEIGQFVTVLTANGDRLVVPLAKVEIEREIGKYMEVVGVLKELPVDCLLGRSSYSKTLSRNDLIENWEKVTGINVNEDRDGDSSQAYVVTRSQSLFRAAQERADKLIDRNNNIAKKSLTPNETKPNTKLNSEFNIAPLFQTENRIITEEVVGHTHEVVDRVDKVVDRTDNFADHARKDIGGNDNTEKLIESNDNDLIKHRNILDRNKQQLINDQRMDANLQRLRIEDRAPTDHDGYFYNNGLLIHRKQSKVKYNGSEFLDRIVLPQAYREEILRIAHSIPIAGHMGQEKTRARIEPHFFWPGCHTEINKYCASCPECQMVARKRKDFRAPLQPVPIETEPFRKVAIDIIGELPRTKSGFKYILTLVDYATRYPEALPLKSTHSKVIADALIGIFSRVGIPEELVSDQGANLIGKLMSELYELLGISKIHTSVYHPEANGLVERFNGTLKSMLRKFAAENISCWDKYLPYLLFAYREVPSSSTGFSPFELLYGRQVRGPLSVIKDNWTEENSGNEGTISHIIDVRRRMASMQQVVVENMSKSQDKQKRLYDEKSSRRNFEVGDKVLVLLPTPGSKLESKWYGPYPIVSKNNLSRTYEVDTGRAKKRFRLFNVNMLTKWQDREEVAALAIHQSKTTILPEDHKLPKTVSTETWRDVVISPNLDSNQVLRVKNLLQKFSDVFSGLPNRTKAAIHNIDTGDTPPIRCTPYRVPQKLEQEYFAEIERMLKLDVIQPSNSPWAFPVVIVPKPDNSIRFCVDYRRLNDVTKMDAYPIPRMDKMLEKTSAANYITTLDLTKGYWQIPLHESAQEKSAFITPRGLYEFKVMPFGMKTSPATFQRMMKGCVLKETKCEADAYIDDVEVDSQNFDQHLLDLEETLARLRKYHLNARPSKCRIAFQTVEFLGHQIGSGHIEPKKALVEAIERFPRPQTKKEVKSFLGLVGFYRKFIVGFSEKALALTDLTRGSKSTKVVWTDECESSFQSLKTALMTAPILVSPNWEKMFIVQVDASNRGLGAVLCQEDDGGHEHPICYASRKLQPREEMLSTTEKECLGIVWAVETFRYYLYGREFRLQTDHNPLVWLKQVKDKSQKLLRWSLILQEFDMLIEHKSGINHKNADALSRI